jgi:xylulose-5-phosphate/fructose-6-phosphate phosphoketolase
MDRYQLALDAICRIPRLVGQVEEARLRHGASIAAHKAWIAEHGEDLPEIRNWRWSAATDVATDAANDVALRSP